MRWIEFGAPPVHPRLHPPRGGGRGVLAVPVLGGALGQWLWVHPIGGTALGGADGQPLAPWEVWSVWHWEPVVLLRLTLSAWLYARGVYRIWGGAGAGHGMSRWQPLAFAGGWAALVEALVSPLDQLGSVLFSAHMLQHELLILIAAPLPLVPRRQLSC